MQDATDQIGCLVQASPCAIGYAGKEAVNWGNDATPPVTSNTVALKVNQIDPAVACIQGTSSTPAKFVYPLARKLYLDSVVGFGALCPGGAGACLAEDAVGDQQKLALYEAKYLGTGMGGIDDVVSQFKFVLIPSVVNGGQPYCEDYNEVAYACAGATTNSQACSGNAAGFPNATNSTTCGNSTIEAYEDCDNGSANVDNGAPGTCSRICRTN
jgi:hypothetical protein